MSTTPRERFTLIDLPAEARRGRFVEAVRAGLTASPKTLPCCYFYDAHGSQLFDAICALPEYYLTRAEAAILRGHASDIAARFPTVPDLLELGSGSADKTRLLIDAFLQRSPRLRYIPLDICRAVLEESSLDLLRTYPTLEVLAIAGEYQDGLAHLRAIGARPKLVLWLGSNVGNLDRVEAAGFLSRVRDTLGPADRLLVGIDLRKHRSILEPAYDDAQGVTAEFNCNLLARINRELRGHFLLEQFRHRAVYNDDLGRVEMYLVSTTAQRVAIDELKLDVSFAAGEAIHTENSYKYSFAEIDELARAAGLVLEQRWLDPDERFSLNLFKPSEGA